MPRSKEKVSARLQQAALDLYQERGYDLTTAAEIAARAGVTERTFFRHFADKREVLFGGEAPLTALLTQAVREAPAELGPLESLFHAFRSAVPMLTENRAVSAPRRRVIANTPQLQERELAKVRSLTSALTEALQTRGVSPLKAKLAAQVAMAATSCAFAAWIDEGSDDLDVQLCKAFHEVRDLCVFATEAPQAKAG